MRDNIGKEYWPNIATWSKSIMFLETSESQEEPKLFQQRIKILVARLHLQHLQTNPDCQ
jgi:hypothetical protein